MDPAVRYAVDKVLDAFVREFDAQVPESGPFPEHRWEVPLPPPYGPSRRLALRVYPGSDRLAETVPLPDAESSRCTVELSVESPDGRWDGRWLGAPPIVGARAGIREEIRSPWTLRRIERFLQRALSGVDDMLAPTRPLDLPLVAIDRGGALYAALDPREVHLERWGPGDLYCATWRLLLWTGETWRDAGVARDQAESERFYLHDRVLNTLSAFDGLSVDGFGFRLWEGSVPARAGRVDGDEIDREDPTVARLREICRAVILQTPNQEEKLIRELRGMGRGDEPSPQPPGLLA